MNKYILAVLMLFSVSVSAMAVDSCKFEPEPDKFDYESYCYLFIEDGKVIIRVNATGSAVPYINGKEMTITQFNSIDKKGKDYVYVEGVFDYTTNCDYDIVNISKIDK